MQTVPDSSMKYRKLRIAWSVFWGLAAVLLIVLWVRSYWWMDILKFPGRQQFGSAKGQITTLRAEPGHSRTSFRLRSYETEGRMQSPPRAPVRGALGFGIIDRRSYWVFFAPHWFACLLLAVFAYAPWM